VYETEETVVYDTGDRTDLASGVGPTGGPYRGEGALEEEGTRYGLGDENTQEDDLVRDNTDGDIAYQPGMRPGSDPLQHGLESEDRI
jgi:hypothetical protein